jgi:hypothetical protein
MWPSMLPALECCSGYSQRPRGAGPTNLILFTDIGISNSEYADEDDKADAAKEFKGIE